MRTGEILVVRDVMSPSTLAEARLLLTDWAVLERIDRDTVDAVVLAGYEAMANCVEHAYRGRGRGPVELRAQRVDEVLTVVVIDWGRWRPPPSDQRSRGRGLTLIRGVTTRSDVRSSPAGTTVTMTWRLAG